jgi:hypothetical protein
MTTKTNLACIDDEGSLQIEMAAQHVFQFHPISGNYPAPTFGTNNKSVMLLNLNYNTFMGVILKHRRNSLALIGALVISMGIFNSSSMSQLYFKSVFSEQTLLSNYQSGQFHMCERPTPLFEFMDDPTAKFSSQKHPKRSKLLLLKDSQTSEVADWNALFHAFDYAHYNDMDLGLTMDGWAMKTIHKMFMQDFYSSILNGKAATAATAAELMETELGVRIITDENQIKSLYEVVESGSPQDLLNYQPTSFLNDWKEVMGYHIYILQRLFRHYNRGNGFDINRNDLEEMSLTPQACSTLHFLFGDSKTPYVVIHAKDADPGAGDVAPLGSLMTSQYMHSVLKEIGMYEYPIVLISDESTASQMVEEELKMDPTIAKNLRIIYSRTDLTGPEVMVGILGSVFIGSPASSTSGFIARSRYALGYRGSTFMFNKATLMKWKDECKDDCVFHPRIMQKLI